MAHPWGGQEESGPSFAFDSTLGFPGEGPSFICCLFLLAWFPATSSSALLGPRNAADRREEVTRWLTFGEGCFCAYRVVT